MIGLGLYKQHIYDHYFAFVFRSFSCFLAIFSAKLLLVTLPVLLLATYISVINLPFKSPGGKQINHAYNLASAIDSHLSDADGHYNLTMLASYNDFRAYAPRFFNSKD